MEKDTNAMFAKKNFKVLCKYLDKKKWKYTKEEEKFRIEIAFSDRAHNVYVYLRFNEELGIVSALTSMSLPEIPENRRSLMAAAITLANGRLTEGNFDYNCLKDKILFRMSTSYIESVLSESLYEYMISVAFHTIKEYYGKFEEICTAELKTITQLKNLIYG
ncbi:MAG: YbjN domain-containing protein [Clostridia bacterium]|nr:YbjN domain-containing protein [Clostridia bacterium]